MNKTNNNDNAKTVNSCLSLTELQSNSGNAPSARRRKALKAVLSTGMVLTSSTIPSKWMAPVVESVTLPAHAQTSGTSANPGCSATAGCYVMILNDLEENWAFIWPGGSGANIVSVFENTNDCPTPDIGTPVAQIVLADSALSAQEIIGPCEGSATLEEIQLIPSPAAASLPNGCNFYWCREIQDP